MIAENPQHAHPITALYSQSGNRLATSSVPSSHTQQASSTLEKNSPVTHSHETKYTWPGRPGLF